MFEEQILPVQTPTSYSFAYLDEGDRYHKERNRFGLAKPSTDGVVRITDPDWIVEDADPETNRLTSDFYRFNANSKRPESRYFAPTFYVGYDYVPLVDYALSGSTLVTSYSFQDCYVADSPLQQAKVWGGVNIYKIDPTTGPKKVFALTTRELEDLKPVPVGKVDGILMDMP